MLGGWCCRVPRHEWSVGSPRQGGREGQRESDGERAGDSGRRSLRARERERDNGKSERVGEGWVPRGSTGPWAQSERRGGRAPRDPPAASGVLVAPSPPSPAPRSTLVLPRIPPSSQPLLPPLTSTTRARPRHLSLDVRSLTEAAGGAGIKGNEGPKGATGQIGFPGPTGPRGLPGAPGVNGANGAGPILAGGFTAGGFPSFQPPPHASRAHSPLPCAHPTPPSKLADGVPGPAGQDSPVGPSGPPGDPGQPGPSGKAGICP
eukprot:1995520-Rhodomonas_salina.3